MGRGSRLDRHGDLNYLFDATGVVSDTSLYDPFGDVAASTGATAPTVGFQSDYTDPSSGEVWMGARWYSGADAVFRSRDSVFGELRTPVSLNRYTYAWASPLNFWDPDGRISCPVGLEIGCSTSGQTQSRVSKADTHSTASANFQASPSDKTAEALADAKAAIFGAAQAANPTPATSEDATAATFLGDLDLFRQAEAYGTTLATFYTRPAFGNDNFLPLGDVIDNYVEMATTMTMGEIFRQDRQAYNLFMSSGVFLVDDDPGAVEATLLSSPEALYQSFYPDSGLCDSFGCQVEAGSFLAGLVIGPFVAAGKAAVGAALADDAAAGILPAINQANRTHIFREAPGHVPYSAANEELLRQAAGNAANKVGTKVGGVDVFAVELRNGSQVWVEVFKGEITNGGINAVPRVWDSVAGRLVGGVGP